MIENELRIDRNASQRRQADSLFELLAWLFMRVSGAILLLLALFHLVYLHFLIPGGVSQIDYDFVAARWSDPAWGFTWRFFDLLLLLLGLTHGANGLRGLIRDYDPAAGGRLTLYGALFLVCSLLVSVGAAIIFGFQAIP